MVVNHQYIYAAAVFREPVVPFFTAGGHELCTGCLEDLTCSKEGRSCGSAAKHRITRPIRNSSPRVGRGSCFRWKPTAPTTCRTRNHCYDSAAHVATLSPSASFVLETPDTPYEAMLKTMTSPAALHKLSALPHLHGVHVLPGRLARQRLPQHNTIRVHISGRVVALRAQHLRRHPAADQTPRCLGHYSG